MTELYWIIGFFGAAFFGLILFAAVYKLLEFHAVKKWLPTRGQIVESRLVAKKKKPGDIGYNDSPTGNVANYAFVKYEYRVKEQKYHCDRVSIVDHGANDEVELTLERYPVGKEVSVFYNPANPNKAVLERDMPAGLGWGIVLLLFLFAGVPIGLLLFTTNATQWIAPFVVNPDRIPVVLLIAGMGVFSTMIGLGIRRQVADSYQWECVKGEIVSATTESYQIYFSDSSVPTTVHRPNIVYMYVVNGRRYAGDRVSFGGMMSSNWKRMFKSKLANYPEGSEVDVFYNPESPGESVLERRATSQIFLWLAAAGLFYFAYAVARGKLQ